MATSKGVIQGYTGVAAVDGKHQIIVCAQAHGTGSEQELLVPVVVAMKCHGQSETPHLGQLKSPHPLTTEVESGREM
jgi:hypothetical protein